MIPELPEGGEGPDRVDQGLGDLVEGVDPVVAVAIALTRRYAAFCVTERITRPVIEGREGHADQR